MLAAVRRGDAQRNGARLQDLDKAQGLPILSRGVSLSSAAVRASLRDLIVCPHCDGLFKAVQLKSGEYARCPDCREPLQGRGNPSPQLVFSSALSGAILLLIAIASPVLTASFGGLSAEVNLLNAPQAFADDRFAIAAYALLLVSVAVPFVQVLVLSWILAFKLAQRRAPGFSWLLPLLQMLRRWAMVEVFFLGTLVVIAKVGGWVSILLGPGFWSLAAFSALLAAVHRFDSASLWAQQDLR
jgi:paraquat-inducible protein A